jgi:hypothetical protein
MHPFVDMMNYPSLYSEYKGIKGISNAWEYYFEPCGDYGIKEVYSNPYVICREKYPYKYVPYYSTTNLWHEGFPTKRQISELNYYIERYVKIKKEHTLTFDKIASDMEISSCVGVHIRGTDMNHTKGHLKPQGVGEVVIRVKKRLLSEGIKKIFLCTDDEVIKEKFQEALDKELKVITLDAYRSKGGSEGIHLEKKSASDRTNHKYMLGVEVLRDAYLLSKCRGLVCGHSNVAYAAMVFNNNHYDFVDCR